MPEGKALDLFHLPLHVSFSYEGSVKINHQHCKILT